MLQSVERISVSPVFIGRGEEMGVLTEALDRAAAGQPQALLIGGEAGVGKTRLLEEFQCTATKAGACVVLGGCLEVGAEGLPYAPFATILRRLHRELGRELELAAEGRESSLARLLPDFGEAVPEANDEFARARLFEHTARLFEKLTADRTLVLAIEDLHWSDRSTRELLAYLIRTLQQSRLVLVATYRSDDLHRRHPVRPYLAELERLRTVQRLELPRLDRLQVASQLAGILAPDEPSPELVGRIWRRSEGNPFFVEELAVSVRQGCGTGLTDSLRDLLLVRVEGLPERTQTLLRVLAEGGSTVEHELLAGVLDWPEEELTESLRSAVGANIIGPSADGDGYRFRHALVREAVSDDLMPGESVRINRRYAEALDARPGLVSADQRAARLAGYWYCAHDAARALPAVLEAGRQARRRNAFAEQLKMLERALELWDDAPAEVLANVRSYDWADDSYPFCDCEIADACHGERDCRAMQLVDLLAEATVAARLSGEADRGLRFAKKALRLVDETTDPERAAWFLLARARAVRWKSDNAGEADLDRAMELLHGRDSSPVLAELLSRRAIDALLSRALGGEREMVFRAVEVARASGARRVELHAQLTLALMHAHFEEHDEADRVFAEIGDEIGASGDVDLLARLYVNESHHLESVGRSAESYEVARKGLEMTRAHGMTAYNGTLLLGNACEPLISMGRLDEAARLLAEAPAWPGEPKHSDFLERLRGEVALLRGDLAEAAAQLTACRESGMTWQPQKLIPAATLAVRIASAGGRYADARAEVQAAIEQGLLPGHEREAWVLLAHGAAAEADARHLPTMAAGRAEALARIRAATAGPKALRPWFAAWRGLVEAELARAEGTDTPELWLATAAAFEASGLPSPRDTALYRAAEAQALAGDREAATASARAALALAREHGDARLVREIEQLADRARLALTETPVVRVVPTASPAFDFNLTPRERDVLRLLAAGRSNRQIAEQLFISPKTASVHVSNILAKLDVPTRGEAAALAHRLRLAG
ncbi:helix-turn-helix transcriptional regulator [Streptacidiphilus monticola]|uniref:AAA family ATPase n=1 Tax=Streptacidiphilus monticola TaxID=2161674 RepID=A0ABW1FXJ7_9ACTN